MNSSLNRRTFLRGAACGVPIAIALPALDIMLNNNGTAHAGGEPLPQRLGVWGWGSEVHRDKYFPTQTGANWELTEELAPLANVRSRITVLSGYDIKTGGISHHQPTTIVKTGQRFERTGPGAFDNDVRVASFDIDVAAALGTGTPFSKLDVGVYSDGIFKGEGLTTRALSHAGPNQPIYPELSPQVLFDRLFGDASTGVHLLGRKSVLNAIKGDTQALLPRLGAADKIRVEQHLDAIRAIEDRIDNPTGGECQAPQRPPVGEPDLSKPDLVLHNELMVELLTMAFVCDLTRVFTFRHHGWTDDPMFWNFGATNSHHNLSHGGGDQAMVHKTVIFTMEQLAKLIDRLMSTPEGDSDLLYNSVIMAYSEVSEGRTHSTEDMPIIIAGEAGGALRTGFHHKGNGETAMKVHLTLVRALGLNWPSFGKDGDQGDYTTESIGELEA
ncbi:MAG: DUF1552 domain-containing protein [Nannocystaceae bacterium]